MEEISLIEPGLYLGSYEAAQDLPLLESLDITHIVNVSSDLPCLHPSLSYKAIIVDDVPDQAVHHEFDSCNSFIRDALEAGSSVLVHW
jgi:protein-tyrosine phosphatase